MKFPKIKLNIDNTYRLMLIASLLFFIWKIIKIKNILIDSSFILTKTQPTSENINNFNQLLLQYDLIDKVAAHNIEYLTISITILIFIGGFVFLFSVKPLQEKMKKQEEDLTKSKEEMENNNKSVKNEIKDFIIEKTEELNKITTKLKEEINESKNESLEKINQLEVKNDKLIDEANIELKKIKLKNEETELSVLWNEYWIWAARDIPKNAAVSLLDYMEKAIEYKNTTLRRVWFQFMLETLQKIVKKDSDNELYKSILKVLENIEDVEGKKYKIFNEVDRILKIE